MSKNIVPSKPTKTEDVAVPAWALKPQPSEPSLPQPLAPSQTSEESAVHSPLFKSSSETFKRGRLIHALLQTLPEIELSKRRDAARHFLTLPAHELSAQNQKAILSETLSVQESPKFAELFGPGSRAEVPIVGTLMPTNGGAPIIVSGQVDRLLITEKEIGIIDYKTNRPPPAVPEEVLPAYLQQIAIYRALLQAIYPGRTTRAAILWTDSARLMTLPEMLLDAHAP